MSFTPGPGTTYVAIQKPATLAEIGALAAASALNTQTTYIDRVTGVSYAALSPTNYYSLDSGVTSPGVNYVRSGLLLPASGSISSATLSAGSAWIDGVGIPVPATPLSLTATRDNYVDLRRDGVVVVTPVTVASAAPALASGSMRLGFVTTTAGLITARSIGAFDSLGNWMYNTVSAPACRVIRSSTSIAYAGAALALPFSEPDSFDNANMHDPAVNNTRFLLPSSGAYQIDCSLIWFSPVTPSVAFTLAPRLTDPVLGVVSDASFDEGYQGTQATQSIRCSGVITGLANQYVEMIFNPNGASGTIGVARFSITKLSL